MLVERGDFLCDGRAVADRDHVTLASIGDRIGHAGIFGYDHGQSRRHRFRYDQAVGIGQGRHDEDIGIEIAFSNQRPRNGAGFLERPPVSIENAAECGSTGPARMSRASGSAARRKPSSR